MKTSGFGVDHEDTRMEQILEWGDGCMRGHTVVIGIVEYMLGRSLSGASN